MLNIVSTEEGGGGGGWGPTHFFATFSLLGRGRPTARLPARPLW